MKRVHAASSRMQGLLRRLLPILLIGGFCSALWAQTTQLHTYRMQRALPEQVLPILEAQIGPGSSVSAYQNQLILNVTDTEYRDCLSLLEQLDVAARSLLISVRKAGSENARYQDYGVNGRIDSGNVQVSTGNSGSRHGSSAVNIRASDSTRSGSTHNSQQVRAVEGMPAFIAVGGSYPLTTHTSPYGTTRELVPVQSGFYATARVIDTDVIVDIDQRDDRVQGRNIATQGIQTQVRGRVGEWIPLGNISGNEMTAENRLFGAGNSGQSISGDVSINVELAPQ